MSISISKQEFMLLLSKRNGKPVEKLCKGYKNGQFDYKTM